MLLNKPKRLVAVINGYEIGVESLNDKEDALSFDQFCDAFRAEVNKFVRKPEEKAQPVMASEAIS